MSVAIRKHLRDFIAIITLVVIAGAVGWVITQNQRLRVPILQEKPFELKAELQTAQAVTAGQGQTVRVAGVEIGEVSAVDLEDGRGVVTMGVERRYLPVYRNATVLLRPKTGLKDMFLELDPGDRSAGEFREGETIPNANTLPDINADEFLAALDADTRDYLKQLITGFGKGLEGRSEDLGQLLKRLGPINRHVARLNSVVGERRQNLRRLVRNLNLLTGSLARQENELAELVDASNAVFGAFASEDVNITRAVARLPGTLRQTRETLEKVNTFAQTLGPTMESLRPFARNLDDANASIRPFARAATPILRDEIRPFVRAAREPVSDLRPAARALAQSAPRQTSAFDKLNHLFNMAAYNPNGAEAPGAEGRDEGYLYWLGWLSHVGSSAFNTQDAHGVMRRIYLTANCLTIQGTVADSPAYAVIANLGAILADPSLCPSSE